MPNITLRQIEPAVVDQIKVIAAQNGRSMQQELRLLVNRFASLPAESRQALTPLAALQVPEWYTKRRNCWRYAAKSSIGRVATPLSIAALATAGATFSIRRGSKGLGIRYSGPKRRPSAP